MIRYLLRRFYLYLITIILLLLILYLAGHYFPVSHFVSLTGLQYPTPEQTEQMNYFYQIDSHFLMQFVAYLSQRLNGNFGVSLMSQQDIWIELMTFLPASLELMICALLIALLVGVPLGIFSALTDLNWAKKILTFVSLTGYSVPIFWFGIILSLTVGDTFHLAPTSGRINLIYDVEPITGFLIIDSLLSFERFGTDALYSVFLHLILPALTLSLYPLTLVIRMTHLALTEVMQTNYIKSAEARGVHPLLILRRHALPNALLLIIRQFGLLMGAFMSYSIINEVIFSWPGMGSWLVEGVFHRDYTVIQAGVFLISFFIITLSFIMDVLYIFMNPLHRKEIYGEY
tara:strand:+ start:1488 stop:2519 length:1032 start_codon:yes stop_codon:yes gene_type:complete